MLLRARSWWFTLAALGAALALLVALGGCGSVGYLSQSVQGHLSVMRAAMGVLDSASRSFRVWCRQ